jgi:dihydrofolate synthase / folylpolyglutamate synthase
MPFPQPNFSQPNSSLQAAVEADLNSFARFGVDLSLDRIEGLLADMGNPHEQVPIIHVAGTNGKGSVCAYLASVLTAAGYRTGRYTSPHLVNWTERICVDGVPISWGDLHMHLQAVKAAIDPSKPTPTQFEVFTAAAWQYFAHQPDQKLDRKPVDIAVVEVGLGGRLDATNVFSRPLATVIVSIGRDHWQRLGNTLAEIAGEKAGILKWGVSAIAAPLPPEAAAVVTARAAELNAPLTWVTAAESIGSDLIYDGIQYPQVLLGAHQRVNSACAIATLQALRQQGWAISDDAIINGMAQVRWPGRLQKSEWQGHSLLIDGAHNREAARSLRAYLDETAHESSDETGFHQPITWLMGMLDTKDHAGVFTELLRPGDRLHLVPVPGHLSADPEELRSLAQKICPLLASTHTHLDLASGLSAAIQTGSLVLCGSLYLIGDFYERYGTE